MIAALYVATNGCYFGLPNVDPWDEARDARLYAGPWPVVAHPPCARWGRYWFGGPSAKVRRQMGDDDGCFAAALASVRKWGGVIEHPSESHAWEHFGIHAPTKQGWSSAGPDGGFTCLVEQGHYGHYARKPTWLYAFGCDLPDLCWGQSEDSWHNTWLPGVLTDEDRARYRRSGPLSQLGKKARAATPPAFRDLLISMAESVNRKAESA